MDPGANMVTPFNRWTDRIIAADDEAARQNLLAEIGRWRTGCLTDVAAQREAAYGMARLFMLVGMRERAVQEGQNLLSLCQTPPEATKVEWQTATGFVQTLGGVVPRRAGRAKPKNKPKKPGRENRDRVSGPNDRMKHWVGLVMAGEGRAVAKALKGKKSPQHQLLRSWISVREVLEEPELERAGRTLRQLEERLRGYLSQGESRDPAPEKATAREAQPPTLDSALERRIGKPLPKRRDARIRFLERFADENPTQIDGLVCDILTHHVNSAGLEVPAPWYAWLVSRALSESDGTKTRGKIEELQGKNALCVMPYSEAPFTLVMEIVTGAVAKGLRVSSVRRGIFPRMESADQKIWTARIQDASGERMIAIAPPNAPEYEAEAATTLMERTAKLCASTVLHCMNPEASSLLQAAETSGLTVVKSWAGEEVLKALLALPAVPPRAPKSAAPIESQPAAAKTIQDVRPALKTMLESDQPLEQATLVSLLGQLRRFRDVFGVIRRVEQEKAPLTADQVTVVLQALHESAPEAVRLLEGTTLALQTLAREAEHAALTETISTSPAAARFGGEGISTLIQLGTGLVAAGWSIDRVFRGTTRRERRESASLETIGSAANGIWRVVLTRNGVKGEVFYLESLQPEGRAALPQLWLEPRNRAVVLPVESDVLSWYHELGGPEPIGWTGAEMDGLLQAIDTWSAPDASQG